MFRYLICYLGSLKAKQLVCFRLVGGHFGFGHLVELAHTFGRDTPPPSFFRVFFSVNECFFYLIGVPYGGPERKWCKYILSRYSDLASRYSDLTKSL